MFSIDQIKQAHSKVKSGAEFPAYIQDLKELGVTQYTTFVSDGHSEYQGDSSFQINSSPIYPLQEISPNSKSEDFKNALLLHQKGGTDYLQFCSDCARTGIEKWIVNIENLDCSYFDKNGNDILSEKIPSLS